MVQTYTPDHPVIAMAAQQDYPTFYEMEHMDRYTTHYPPYADLFLFGFTGLQEHKVRLAADKMLQLLRASASKGYEDLPLIALDPTPASVVRVAGKYRYKMLVKSRNTKHTRDMVRHLLHAIHNDPVARGVTVYVDINPASML